MANHDALPPAHMLFGCTYCPVANRSEYGIERVENAPLDHSKRYEYDALASPQARSRASSWARLKKRTRAPIGTVSPSQKRTQRSGVHSTRESPVIHPTRSESVGPHPGGGCGQSQVAMRSMRV